MYVVDVEIYVNYFLLAAKHVATGEMLYFEDSLYHRFDRERLHAFMRENTTISFNGNGFDLPIILCACDGWKNEKLKALADKIINSKSPSWRILKDMGIEVPRDWDHIDLMEVAPGRSSLKIYGGRMHMPRLEDLPIEHDAELSRADMAKIKSYCVNDLDTTIELYRRLEKVVALRADMSEQYGVDLRSKSDAQVAETVIVTELQRLTGRRYYAPDNPPSRFRYKNPEIIAFESPELRALYYDVLVAHFNVNDKGGVDMPKCLTGKVTIGGRAYKTGIGGLHSEETAQMVQACDQYDLLELDVTSYYPSIVLQQDVSPEQIGRPFLHVYRSLVERRVKAKREGDKAADAMLKIAVNGSYGKLGSKYSAFYAPNLMVQVTVTGQLALLMLIERLHLAGIDVVSANTDGVVVYVKKSMRDRLDEVAFEWMMDTTYGLEETNYRIICSRNVNNYIAVTTDGRIKGKGCFAPPSLSKNPDFQIIYDAVANEVSTGEPAEQTIRECNDITKFVCVRNVTGGAVWRDQKLGRAVRFYHSTEVPESEAIRYAKNGNTVPKSSGARPLMNLPDEFPSDVNFAPYIEAAEKLLVEIGYAQEEKAQVSLF